MPNLEPVQCMKGCVGSFLNDQQDQGSAIFETGFSDPRNSQPGSGPAIQSPGFKRHEVFSQEPGPDSGKAYIW